MSADRHHIGMDFVHTAQPLAQAPDQGIEGLLRYPRRFILTPNLIDQILSRDNLPIVPFQCLQQAELLG